MRIKSISIAAETHCTTKKLTASRKMNPIDNKTNTGKKMRRREQKHNKSQLKLTTPARKVNNTTDLQQQSMQQQQPNKLQLTFTATTT